MDNGYPRYYAVNDRPVKIVLLPNGGSDCLVFDFDTGGFTPDRDYFTYVFPGSGKDVDSLSEAEFEQLVAARRVDASRLRLQAPIQWTFSVETGPGYQAQHRGRSYLVRLNPPDQLPYTLFVDGQKVEDLHGWPPAWVRIDEVEKETPGREAAGPGMAAAVLRKWSEQLCQVESSAPGTIVAALGLQGRVVDHLTYCSVEPPPEGVAKVLLVHNPAGFDYIQIFLMGSRPTRGELDASLGEGSFMPRVHAESLHKLAYYVAVRGAPFKCAVFAGFTETPTPAAVAKELTIRRDRVMAEGDA